MEFNFASFSSPSIIWVPCIPDYSNGTFTPVYNLNNLPQDLAQKVPVLPRGGIKSRPWNHDEDNRLRELVNEHGVKKWAIISKTLNSEFGNARKGKNCRERWNNHLNPRINKGEWTYNEDFALLTKEKELGKKWSAISKVLDGRTENSVKNRWNTLVKTFMQSTGSSNEEMATDYLINHISSMISSGKE